MLRLDMKKVTGGTVVELEENPPKRPEESEEDAKARFAGETQWVKLAFSNGNANKRFQRRMEALQKPYRRQIQLGTIKEELADELLLTGFLEMILLDWGNIPIPGAIPFTVEGAKAILSNPEYALLFAELQQQSSIAELFAQEALENDGKN